MRKMRRVAAWLAVVGIVAGVSTAAALADGRNGSESITNDGGAWLINRAEGVVGHANRVVGEIDSVAGPFAGAFEISQARGVVATMDRSTGDAVLIDTKFSAPGASVGIPASASVMAFPDGVVVLEAATGRLWRFSRDEFGALSQLDDVAPLFDLRAGGLASVGLDGRVAAVTGDGSTMHVATPDGEWHTVSIAGAVTGPDQAADVTVVGDRSVVLHKSGRLSVVEANGDTREFKVSNGATLQQPSTANPGVVVVHVDGSLSTVDLSSGAESNTAGASSVEVRPIVHRGCIWSITTNPVVFHYCGRDVPLTALGSNIRLILVNNWVWVNDVNAGGVWFVREDNLEVSEISDWSAALKRNDNVVTDAGVGGEEKIIQDANADELLDDVDGLDDDGKNESPLATDDIDATRQARPVVVDVLANDTDPDHDPLSVASLSDVDVNGFTGDKARVTVSADGRLIQVVPDVDFVGTVRFGYTVSDGRGGQDSAQVSVDVVAPDEATNRAPIPTIDNATVRAGDSVSLNVLSNDSDPDGDVLVLTGVGDVDGAIGFTPDGEVQFTPNVASPEGTVDIPYTVVDDYNEESAGTIRVRIRPAGSNQPPQARNDIGQGTVGRAITLNVLTNDSDPDGDPLIAQNLQTADGASTTASLGPDGQFLFRPEQPGTFRFQYTVSDGPTVDVSQIRITVTETTENRPPAAVADVVALAIGETRLVRVLENDGDPDGDIVGLVDWSGVSGLVITEVPGVGFYVTPTPNASPRSVFQYWISDGVNDPTMGTVVVSAIQREAVDYPPVAVVDTIDARAGSTTTINVLRNDHDPEGAFLEIAGPVINPPEALVRISADKQTLRLTVNPDQQFSFAFSYDVVDPAGNRGSALVNVRVVPTSQTNRAPIAGPDTATTPFHTPVYINALDNDVDPDGDAIAIESIAEQPLHGDVEVAPDGRILYRPRDGFSGTDRFVYTLVDAYQPPLGADGQPLVKGGPERDQGEVLVGVMAPSTENRSPIAVDDNNFAPIGFTTDPAVLKVLANDSDPDGDLTVVTGVTTPSVGSVEISPGRDALVYTPPTSGTPRPVSFRYTIADGRGGTATATVTLNLVEAPDPIPPVAVDDQVGPTVARAVITLDPRTNDLDPDGDASKLTVVTDDPALRVLPDGQVEITAPTTTSEFKYRVRDQQGLLSEPGIISVIVTDNQAPLLAPITTTTAFNTPIDIDLGAAATDPDGDPLVINIGSQRFGGAVTPLNTATGLTVRFQPDTDFVGDASFDFSVDDRNGHTVAGNVLVTVQPPENRQPNATNSTVTTDAGTDAIVRLSDLVTDPDGPVGHQFSIANASGPITARGPNNGVVVASSDIADGGTTGGFDYTIVDGPYTVTKRITINLNVPNYPPPTLASDTATTLQGQSVTVPVLNNDADNTPGGASNGLRLINVGPPKGGTATASGNSVVFTPDPDFFGTATFTYTVQDVRKSPQHQSTADVSITVIGRPAAPAAPSVGTVGDGYVVLGWNAPAGDAARGPVTGYVLSYSGADGTSNSITFNQPTTSHRWDGLTNGVKYCFAVAATNQAGTGDTSAATGTACGTPDIRPEAPSAPVVKFDDTQLKISWAPPLNRGTPIKNYQLRISGGKQALSPSLGATTEYTWTGLTNGTDYTFEVRAQNSAQDNEGWSDWSPLSAPEHPLTVPKAPNQPDAKRGDRQVLVTWNAPDNGGDTITRYEVRSSLSPSWITATAQGQTNTYRWENIPNGTDVSFQVRAINRDPLSTNPGNISVSSPTVRTCYVPDMPAEPIAVRGDTTATVTWKPPYSQGCDITEYRITASNGDVQTASANATSHTFTGLTNGTPYTFTVTAINEVVTKDGIAPRASFSSNEVTPAGPPLATNVTSAENVGVRQTKVAWNVANDNGSPITSYELSINGGAWTNVGNVTSITRTEKSDGTTYTYKVRAINAIGTAPSGAGKSVTTWDVPSRPTVTITSVTATSITFVWSAPDNDGGTPITKWTIGYNSFDCYSNEIATNPSPPYTLTSAWGEPLRPGTTLYVAVRYYNDVGYNWGCEGAQIPKS